MIYDEFPHTITFQTATSVPDGMGGHKTSWEDFLEIEAFVCPVTGRSASQETYVAQQSQTPINYHVFFPFETAVKSSMRIKYEDKYLSIESDPLDSGGQGEKHMLKCSSLEVKS
jgi:SPP1 family predicted phage head-tail adaptor